MPSAINWSQVHTRPLLMIPGPTELPVPVLQALNQPATIQYDRSFDEGVLEPTARALADVFQTRHEVILMPGSGRTALEAGSLSVIEPGDRVLVVGAGQFGVLMREIMNRVGADWTEFPVEWGARLDLDRLAREAERLRPRAITLVHNETSTGSTYPAAEVGRLARAVGALFMLDTVSSIAGIDVRTDEWGVDLNMTGSQKCLAAPLGLGLVAVSPRAWEAMERRKTRAHSYAYDLLRWREQWVPVSRGGKVPDGTPRRQPVSIPTHLTDAMRVAREEIFCPILPVLPYEQIEDAIQYIAARARPLALYYFGKDADEASAISRRTHAGGVTLNDWGWHVFQHDLPFGGIGASGMGKVAVPPGAARLSTTPATLTPRR